MVKQEKKRINVKIALTNLFMAVSVIAIVAALTLVAMGYRLEGGELTQYGLLQVTSIPGGAGVEVDGIKVDTTDMSEMLPGGKHNLVVTKSGYDVWRGEVEVRSGLLKRVDWVRLFPVDKVTEVIGEYEDMVFVSTAPARDVLLVVRSGANWTIVENVDGGTVTAREIEVPEWLIGQEILQCRWNKNGDKLFVKVGEEWGMVDLRVAGGSTNITREFSMKFDDIAIANDAGDKVYVLENGNLRVADLRDKSVSGVRVTNVVRIGGEGELVGYAQSIDGKWAVGVYRDGENVGKVIFQPEGEGAAVKTWRYWGEDIVAGVFDGELVVMRGVAYGGMREMMRVEVGEVGSMEISPSGRFLVGGGRLADVSNGKTYEVVGGKWMDDFLMYAVREGKLVVWDFNGKNERSVGEVADGEVMISRSDSWLYYVEQGGNKVVREKL